MLIETHGDSQESVANSATSAKQKASRSSSDAIKNILMRLSPILLRSSLGSKHFYAVFIKSDLKSTTAA